MGLYSGLVKFITVPGKKRIFGKDRRRIVGLLVPASIPQSDKFLELINNNFTNSTSIYGVLNKQNWNFTFLYSLNSIDKKHITSKGQLNCGSIALISDTLLPPELTMPKIRLNNEDYNMLETSANLVENQQKFFRNSKYWKNLYEKFESYVKRYMKDHYYIKASKYEI